MNPDDEDRVASPEDADDVQEATKAKASKLIALDISREKFRLYKWLDEEGNIVGQYQIKRPSVLYLSQPDGTSHRILDIYGFVHLVPYKHDKHICVIVWQNEDGEAPCRF